MRILLLGSLLLMSFQSWAYLSVSPSHINFGRVEVNRSSLSRTVWVRNLGQEATDVYVRRAYCDFNYSYHDDCFWTLEPGDSCRLTINYRPRSEGYHQCRISVEDDHFRSTSVSANGQGYEREWP
jgi:hypothetical protein